MTRSLLQLLSSPFRPLVVLLRPGSHTTSALRRVLYATSLCGVLGALFAGLWTLGHLLRAVLPEARVQAVGDDSTLAVLSIVATTAPFVLMAVLQGSSAWRVLGKVPDRTLVDVPGLAAMNTIARVLYGLISIGLVVIGANGFALGVTVAGGVVALAITLVFASVYVILFVVTVGTIRESLPFFDTIGQVWDRCTFARHFFEAQASLVEWLAIDPDWLVLVAIVLGYAVPTALAVTVWAFRDRFRAMPV